jgi:hypothetical protein
MSYSGLVLRRSGVSKLVHLEFRNYSQCESRVHYSHLHQLDRWHHADSHFYKSDGFGETGLGLICHERGCDHEIEPGQSIALNLNNLLSHSITGATLILSSLQSGETGSACDGFTCVNFSSGNNASAVNITSLLLDMQHHHVSNLIINAGSGDVLLAGLQVSAATVPEPSSLFLMGSGLIGIAGMVRRKFRP